MEVNSWTALNGISTDRKRFREKAVGERFLRIIFGTCPGALYENTTYAGVNGLEMSVLTLIRVVPPSFSVPYGDGKTRRFFVFIPINNILGGVAGWLTKN